MNDTTTGQWILRWDKHPTKTIIFTMNHPQVLVWGTGFQGLDDPPPKAVVHNTSKGTWTLDLDNENASTSLGIEYAREIWNALLDLGWARQQ